MRNGYVVLFVVACSGDRAMSGMFMTLPRIVLLSSRLSIGAKCLYGVLYSAMHDDGAVDLSRAEIMAEMGQVEQREITRWLRELQAAELVRLDLGDTEGAGKAKIVVRSPFGRSQRP